MLAMRDITRLSLRVLNSEGFSPVDLLDLRIAGSSAASTLYFTNAGEQLTWGGNTYQPINFSRSELREVLSVESSDQPGITITAANVDGQLGQLLGRVELQGARATLHTYDRGLLLRYPDRTRDYAVRFGGEVQNVSVTEQAVMFQIVGVLGLLDNIVVPKRVYQQTCNYTYGSQACGANLSASPNTIETTVLSGSLADSIRVGDAVLTEAGDPDDPNDFWLNGYIVIKDGLCACQARPIHRVVVGGGVRKFFVTWPFLLKPAPGDTILIRRGCPKTKQACQERPKPGQSDPLANYGGFEETPFGEVRPPAPIRGF